ncbi:MAG: GGDEF domain-containing protein [Spirochaetia bacterium]|jgi:diguanylate cyclase (GGDEF)-like protein
MQLISRLEGWPTSVSMVAGALLVSVIGVLDYVTGYELTFSAFYLLPIFIFAWLGGNWGGIGGAVASAAVRTLVDLFGGKPYSSALSIVWNTGMRLALFVVVALLISLIRKYVDQERALARIDHLTGAANKRSFEELLQAEIERSRRYSRPFTLAYFDLDNFKLVNDSFGHAAGDGLLHAVVSIIRANVRATDVVARLGGDEFALLMPETDESSARTAISKIQSHIKREMQERARGVTVSIGSLTCSNAELSVEELIHQADDLMYAAKIKGRNTAEYAGTEKTKGTPPRPS